jgi:hypothetical protein
LFNEPVGSGVSSVGIAKDYRLDGQGSIPGRSIDSSLLHSVSTGPGATQPPIKWVPGALSADVKRPGSEADYSPPSSAEVRVVELYLHSPISLHGSMLN